MFTGLVEEIGTVSQVADEVLTMESRERQPTASRARTLQIRCPQVSQDAELGSSICINGCCLTVTEIRGEELSFQAGDETLSKTNLGHLVLGSQVNLERSLKPDSRMGGHYVSGHVDALGEVRTIDRSGEWARFEFSVPPELTVQMASKGSVAVDGISLTLVDVGPDGFSVALIPHTLEVTTLGERRIGDTVNIETDILAKYVQKQLQAMQSALQPALHPTGGGQAAANPTR